MLGMTRRVRRAIQITLACATLYTASYLILRFTNTEVWQQDGRAYVIIPTSARVLYYVFRPMMYLDSAATGMRFHIGPHRVREGTAPE